MAAPLNVDRLLAPITEAEPSGVWLRYDGVYDRIREARREDDPSLPRGVWEKSLKVADPAACAALCSEALERRTKDLQIAAWLSDAWGQLHGITGVAQGLDLVAQICGQYWATLFPALEDEDSRFSILEWLDEAMARRIRAATLGDAGSGITLADWDRAGALPRPDDVLALTREGLLARMSLVGATRWAAVGEEVRGARRSATTLERVLAERASDPPTLRRTDVALNTLEDLVEQVRRMSGGAPLDRRAAGDEARLDPGANQAPRDGGAAPIDAFLTSRAEAYRRLSEAADYLLRTEPHSPVPYLVKRAIGWGNMSLAELLQEFVSSADDLVLAQRLLGMRRRDE